MGKTTIKSKSSTILTTFLVCSITMFATSFLMSSNRVARHFYLNHAGYCSVVPDDPYYGTSWHLSRIEAEKAWEITTGRQNVFLAILDSGINNISPYQSTDLSPNIDSINSLDLSYDYNGTPLFDYLSYHPNGCHGTRVASIIGSKGNNSVDSAGICWNVNMLSIKCSGYSSGIDFGDISTIFNVNSQNYRGYVPIMNMSLGLTKRNSEYNQSDTDALYQAINSYNGLIVVSAGNGGKDLDNPNTNQNDLFYPAVFDCDNIIVVGSSSQNNEGKCSNSNYGSTSVDLFAPGENINSHKYHGDENGNIYYDGICGFDGTSAAAPQVAATAALIKSVNPNYSTGQIKAAILNNVDYLSSLNGLCVSGGRLNVYKAVKSAIPVYSSLNSVMSCVQSLDPDEHQFYKVNLTPGTYLFETTGSLDLYGSLFTDIQNNPVAIDADFFGNCSFTYTTNISRTVYFKVQNLSLTSGSYGIKISETLGHIHSYNDSYIWINANQHRAYCSCLSSVLQPHTVTPSNPHYCILCGGYADLGGIGPLSTYEEVGNDSRLTPNGVVILGNIDYELISSGELTIEQLLLGGSIL